MPNAFEAYQRGQALAMQQGQNALRMEQAVQKMQRDKQLRDILAGAYTQPQAGMPAQPAMPAMAEVPEMGVAPAMGAIQPGAAPLPDYPEQMGMPAQEAMPAQPAVPAKPGGMDMQQALGAMYQGGFGPEAMSLEAKQASLAGTLPASPREFEYLKKQFPSKAFTYDDYLGMKRQGYSIADIGGVKSLVNRNVPDAPAIPLSSLAKEKIAITEKKRAGVAGTELGKEEAALANLEASLPNLKNVVERLSQLGQVATYTKAGVAAESAARQMGLKSSEGAIARKEYISMVDNEILPLLKQTFGAAFTQKEGETLKATLGDPDASPEEKDAVLKSFIKAKTAQIATKRRRVGGAQPAPMNQDKAALKWANANPNDPRAMQILQRLGAR